MKSRYNQIGFTLVEVVLSGVYVWSLLGLLNLKGSVRQRRVMLDLIYINVIIVSLDIVVVILVYLNQTGISHPMQTCSYAVKLKLEFVVLNQLMATAARGLQKTNFEERRYNQSSAADGFSAMRHDWDRKTPDFVTKEHQESNQRSQKPSHSGSVQINLPSPALSKQDQGSGNSFDKDGFAASRPKQTPSAIPRSMSQDSTFNQENIDENMFEMEEGIQPKTFLDVDENQADTIRHKPSEAFSGSTLQSPILKEASPHPYPRNARENDSATRSKNHPMPPHRQSQDRLVSTRNQRKTPHIARMRKNIPQNARYVHDDDEEEEIGVHMWENRKGSLVLEVPWFESRKGV